MVLLQEEKKPEESKVEEKKTEEPKKAEEEKKEEAKPDKPSDEKKAEESKEPPPPQEIILRVYMHCEGCARKVRRCLKGFPGNFSFICLSISLICLSC